MANVTETKKDSATAALLLLILLVPSIIFRGFILSYMWLWFVVPLGVASIGIANAIGISTLIHFFLTNIATKKKDENTTSLNYVLNNLVFMPLFVFWMAWVVHLFM